VRWRATTEIKFIVTAQYTPFAISPDQAELAGRDGQLNGFSFALAKMDSLKTD
jgi:hypothetical protein